MTKGKVPNERDCSTCHHAKGQDCLRDGVSSQSFELRYTDDDFCGPDRRYYVRFGALGEQP